jgi:phosphatidylethanolamine/phosphatidyl-N-methylethanolamine N-methyltransferase
MPTKEENTEVVRRRWNRTARRYDYMMALVDRVAVRKWRRLLWSRVESSRVLEIGVGTGNNFSYYPADAEMTAVDFSEEMLKRAKNRASSHKVKVNLRQMDAQNLEFADNTFDTVAASMVFCAIPDPVRGIREVERVCKQGGKVVLLEQDFSANWFSRWLVKVANPLIARMGSDFRRRPLENVAKSGLKVEAVTNLWGGVFKLIEARKL